MGLGLEAVAVHTVAAISYADDAAAHEDYVATFITTTAAHVKAAAAHVVAIRSHMRPFEPLVPTPEKMCFYQKLILR